MYYYHLRRTNVTKSCLRVNALSWDLEVVSGATARTLRPTTVAHHRSPLQYRPRVRGSGVRGQETRETCTGGGHGKNGFGFNSKLVKRWGVGPGRDRSRSTPLCGYSPARRVDWLTCQPSLISCLIVRRSTNNRIYWCNSLLITLILVFGWRFNFTSKLFGGSTHLVDKLFSP